MPRHRRLEVRWSTIDPDALATRLRACGLTVSVDGSIAFAGAMIRLTLGSGRHDRLELADPMVPAAPAAAHPNGVEDLVAIGLATVDRQRAVAAVATGSVVDLPRDPHLGAYVLRHASLPYLLVLEPDTEGRLAATLARHGEGPAAIYLRVGAGRLAALVAEVRRRGGAVSTVRPGPLGRSVILLGGPTDGPHLLVVEAARPNGPAPLQRPRPGTIDR